MTTYEAMPAATPLSGSNVSTAGLRAAATAAETVADVIDRWYNNYGGVGVGLYGGTWSYTGDRVTRFRLQDVRLTGTSLVSGTVVWSRYGHAVTVNLVIKQVDGVGRRCARQWCRWDGRRRLGLPSGWRADCPEGNVGWQATGRPDAGPRVLSGALAGGSPVSLAD